jgi:hypothetical protein
VHGLLHVGIEILHAKAQPIESDSAQRSEARRCHGSRIDLDRHLDIAGQIEGILQRRDEPLQLLIRQEGGRTAAEVELPDGAVPAKPGLLRVAEGGESPDGEECPVCGDRFVNLNRHLKSHAPAKAAAAKKARTPAQIAATERMQAAAEAKRAQAGG